MTKTIEEAAWNFARKQWGKQVPHSVNEIADMLIDFGNEISAMSLSDRLTAEEKEQIKKLYCAAEASESDYSRGYLGAIKRIFGKDFLKEGE